MPLPVPPYSPTADPVVDSVDSVTSLAIASLPPEYHAAAAAAAHPLPPPPDYFAPAPADCPHWVRRQCRLIARPRHCCTCRDARPCAADGQYPVYVDGQAAPGSVERWAHYCTPCRDAEHRQNKQKAAPSAKPARGSSEEEARARSEQCNKKTLRKKKDDSGRWETVAQQKRRARQERKRARDEAAEARKDAAWEAAQQQRLECGQSVAGVIVWRYCLPADRTGKGKGKGSVWVPKDTVTPADVRAARLLWEAGSTEAACEPHRAEAVEEDRTHSMLEALQAMEYEAQIAAKKRHEYEAYRDSILGRGEASSAAAAAAPDGLLGSGFRWLARLFGRRDD